MLPMAKIIDIFKALSCESRFNIVVKLINETECNVKALAEELKIPQPNVSQHLLVLKNAGIIEGYKQGTQIRYRVINDFVIKTIKTSESALQKGMIISLIFLMAFSPKVFAEELSAQKFELKELDFKEALMIALENNNELRAMKKALCASERNIGIERSQLLPHLSVGETFETTNNPVSALGMKLYQARVTSSDLGVETLNTPGTIANFLTYGMLEQVILDKKSMVEVKIAQTRYSENGYIYLRKQEDLMKAVAQAFISISMDEDIIKVIELDLDDKKEQLKIAEIRYKSKKGPYSTVLEATTLVALAEQKLVTAKRNLVVTKRALGLLLGTREAVEIAKVMPKFGLCAIEYYKQYAEYRNDVKAMDIHVQNSKNNIKLAQADWYPRLTMNAIYNLNSNTFPLGVQGNNYIAGAFFRWEAFDGNKRKYEILKAKDQSIEAKENLEWLKKTVDFKVFESYSKVEELNENLKIAITALKAAEEGKNLIIKRWQNSLSKFVEVEEAQANLDKARAEVVNSRDELKLELINLYFESGTIKKELQL
jgi:outer membrane protein TolC